MSETNSNGSTPSEVSLSAATHEEAIEELRRQLQVSREELQAAIEQKDAVAEELRATNAELHTINRRLVRSTDELSLSQSAFADQRDELTAVQEDMQLLLRSTRIPTIALDEHHQIRYFTPDMVQFYGLGVMDIGRPLKGLPCYLRDMVELPHPNDMERNEVREIPVRLGSSQHFLCRITPLQSRRRGRTGLVMTFVNLTAEREQQIELKNRETELAAKTSELTALLDHYEQANARLSVLFDQSPFYTATIATDGSLLDLNQVALQKFELRRHEVIGIPFWDAKIWTAEQSARETLKDEFQKVIGGKVFRHVVKHHMPDGSVRHSDFTYSPAYDLNDQVIFAVATGSDITEQVIAQRELHRSEGFTTAILQSSPDSVQLIDGDGTLRMINGSGLRIFETDDASELNGRPWADLWSEDQRPTIREHLRMAGERGGARFRVSRTTSADAIQWWDVIVRRVGGSDGLATQFVAVARDVTEIQNSQEAMEKAKRLAEAANASKSIFVANMSHEIRTPMTAILGYADVLIRDTDEREEEKLRHLQTIKRNGNFLLEIINDILDISKIEAGRLEIQPHRFSPVRLLEEVVSVMQVRTEHRPLQLRTEFLTRVPRIVRSDRRLIKQILINLVGNALKFTEEGEVVAELQFDPQKPDALTFRVRDTGCGIEEAKLKRLFTPFVQGDASVTRRFGGSGLGLAISNRLAEALGGSVEVKSEVGKGSTFSCHIQIEPSFSGDLITPQIFDEAEEVDASAIPEDRYDDDEIVLNCTALVVDDSDDIRYLSRRLLSNAGVKVFEAVDGLEALDHVRDGKERGETPDVVLLDMQMPRMDGYRAARSLREMGYEGPIIALTADAMHGDMKRCLDSGCNDYLSKPIHARTLLEKIQEVTEDPR